MNNSKANGVQDTTNALFAVRGRRVEMEMLAGSRLRKGRMVVDEPNNFRVATAAYLDPRIFEEEMHHIFYSTWIFLCHETEIANPGDYKSTRIGLKPVIVVRDRQGKVNAFLNFSRGSFFVVH